MIPLRDPFVEFFGINATLTRDLFFSGHTSLMMLLYLTARRQWLRHVYMMGTLTLAVCVVIQHVHYAFDVFVAPFVAYGSVRLVGHVHVLFGKEG
jgi:hypothetical protein